MRNFVDGRLLVAAHRQKCQDKNAFYCVSSDPVHLATAPIPGIADAQPNRLLIVGIIAVWGGAAEWIQEDARQATRITSESRRTWMMTLSPTCRPK
jgi:hypothetical protein